MSQPELDEARLLLRKAREDADALEKLTDDGDIADSVVGFHAQQAAEKALKSVLAATGSEFPWTHDLRYLIERLEESGEALGEDLKEVRTLGPWAVEFRYGETIEDSLDRAKAKRLVDDVLKWARGRVEAAAAEPASRDEQASEPS